MVIPVVQLRRLLFYGSKKHLKIKSLNVFVHFFSFKKILNFFLSREVIETSQNKERGFMSKHSDSHFLSQLKRSFSGTVNARSIVAVILFGMIVAVFVLSDLSGRAGGKGGSLGIGSAASVNGQLISIKQFQDQEARMANYYAQLFGGKFDNEFQKRQVMMEALNQLVNNEVAYQAARQEKVYATDAEIQKAILEMPVFKKDGVFQSDLYKNILTANRLSVSDFEDSLRQQVSVQKVQALFDMAYRPTELEKSIQSDLKSTQIAIEYVQLTPDLFNKASLISDNAVTKELENEAFRKKVEEYYKNNSAEFETPEQVKASHILIKTEGTDEAAAKAKAENILKEAKKGDFGQLAAKHSDDPGSKAKNGDLGYFSRGRMVKEFEEAAFSLKAGEVSGLVKSPFGFHIIKVMDRKAAQKTSEKESFMKIGRKMLADQKLTEVAQKLEKEIANQPQAVDALLKEYQLAWKDSGYFDLSLDAIPGLNSALVFKAALELNAKNPYAKNLIRDGDSQYLVKFKDLKKMAANQPPEQTELLVRQKSYSGFQKWVNGYKQTSKIEYNDQILK